MGPGSRAGTGPSAHLGGVIVGGAHPVAVMGVLNVSPESFYPGSVHGTDALRAAGAAMVDAGAALLDVGAMSTAPYRAGRVDAGHERDRLVAAVEALAAKVSVPLSVDTARVEPLAAALDAGASVLNDVTGLADPAVARLAAARGVPVIAMASPAAAAAAGVDPETADDPITVIRACLAGSLARARAAGLASDRIVLDPGIGFFLSDAEARAAWDAGVLARLGELADLGRPLAVGVSRKSFIGTITGRRDPADRLAGSLAATALAVAAGAALVRTHDVAATLDAVRLTERLLAAGAS
ncbi:MAG: dihydropteroate synthase [Candidatus Rokubacteria bacterium]|nr:dihydropteroate synthase [Candidatus Rokubacteria bacterium]